MEEEHTDLSDDDAQVSRLSETASCTRDHMFKNALNPVNSFVRFKESFLRSNASEATKAKFARLTNMPYNDGTTAANEAARGVPNPSLPPVKGQPHERLARAGWG